MAVMLLGMASRRILLAVALLVETAIAFVPSGTVGGFSSAMLAQKSMRSKTSYGAVKLRSTTTLDNMMDRFFGGKSGSSVQKSQPSLLSDATGPVRPGDKVGILFLNLGGPEKLSEVEDFLFNLFNDPDIIRLPSFIKPFQPFIARAIARRRAPDSRHNYESIGGGSPICKLTQEQADKLEAELRSRGIESRVYIGMRYWYPFTEEAVDRLLKDDVNRLVIMPLYPQYSISTTGSSIRLINQIMKTDLKRWDPRKIDHTIVPDYFDHPGYLACQAKLIKAELAEFSGRPNDVKVMFSAHGVPESYVKAGDPYKGQIERCARLIMEQVNDGSRDKFDYVLSFQSRVGPVKWLEPYTDVVLQELGAQGLKNLVVVPLSFTSEHVETLEEIDQEYREIAEEAGIHNFKRVPALNSDPLFIGALADLTVDALEKPSLRVNECLSIYQDESDHLPGYPWEWGVTRAAEQWNGRFAMIGIAALAVSQVLRVGCPVVNFPTPYGKEPFCAVLSYDGWSWLVSLLTHTASG